MSAQLRHFRRCRRRALCALIRPGASYAAGIRGNDAVGHSGRTDGVQDAVGASRCRFASSCSVLERG